MKTRIEIDFVKRTVKRTDIPDREPPVAGAAHGSALACRIADKLMEGWQGFHASRLQLRGPEEQDMGGLCRQAVVRIIDNELDAAALNKAKPKLFRKIRRILKAPNDELKHRRE